MNADVEALAARMDAERAERANALRDKVAVAALAALIAKHPYHNTPYKVEADGIARSTAKGALDYADAFMAERAKRLATPK